MKQFIFGLLISISFFSCSSEFNKIEQAKNEVTKDGYRDGRWVDFYDSSGIVVDDKTNGYKFYLLSEYVEGKLIGETRLYNNKGVLVQRCIPYEDLNPKFEKKFTQNVKYMKIIWYDLNGYLEKESVYNKLGFIVDNKGYVRIGDKDELVSNTKTTYYNNDGLKKTEEGFVILPPNIKLKHNFYIQYKNSIENQTVLKKESLLNLIKEKLILKSKGNEFLASIVFNESDIETHPFRIEYAVADLDTVFVGKIISSEVENYKSQLTSRSVGGSGSVQCDYCGITFNKANGFVFNIQITINRCTSYSWYKDMLNLMSNMGLSRSYLERFTDYYCSQRCCNLNGYRVWDN